MTRVDPEAPGEGQPPGSDPGRSRGQGSSPGQLWRRRLTLAAVVTLVSVALVEALLGLVFGNLDVVRFVHEPGDGRCVGREPDSRTNYTGMLLRIPAVVHTVNEDGYRGPARPKRAAPGTTRIVALGDSFTFGQGVADDATLPATLEAKLQETRAAGAGPVEVLNFGIPGLNLAEIHDQYVHFARAWEPTVVVVFLFENDLDQSMCALLERRVFLGLVRGSKLVRLGVALLAPEALGAPDPRPSPERIAALTAQLGELRDEVEADGARLMVVSIADPLADAEATRAITSELGIPALVFEREHFEEFETIPNESHWTVDATAAAAAEVAGWLGPLL